MGAAGVDRLARQWLGLQARQGQQCVDHAVHARGGGQHALQVVVADSVEEAAVVFLQDAGEALDHADRRAQVVRDGVAERLALGLRIGIGRRASGSRRGRGGGRGGPRRCACWWWRGGRRRGRGGRGERLDGRCEVRGRAEREGRGGREWDRA